ncbi:MAG: hypothetical protein IJ455_03025 [Agathobacter sp.]|nr:hypothetical protein [Agathobacter sp.]
MQIVLSILQFLGWVLLAAVVVVVFALLILLFCPVRYLVDIHWLEEQWAKFRAHWFFHLIRAKVSYGDDLIYGEIHIFWKKITFSFDLTEKKEEEESEKEDKQKETKEASDVGIISKIKGMIERIKAAYPKVKKILTDEKNKEAIVHLKDEILYFLKVLLPKKSKVDAVFSTGSPDTTGQLFGVLACFPAMYHKDWKLIPDFESDDMYFKGTFWGKGRIYGYEIVGIILRIIFDKNCRRLYTIINRFIKWLKKSDNTEGNVNG